MAEREGRPQEKLPELRQRSDFQVERTTTSRRLVEITGVKTDPEADLKRRGDGRPGNHRGA